MMKYQNLTIVDYDSQYYSAKAEHVLVDVRSPYEYESVHIPNALNIPLEDLQARLGEIPQDRPIIVVCASGNRSRVGADILTAADYAPVYNLQGGTMSWMIGMRPTVRG